MKKIIVLFGLLFLLTSYLYAEERRTFYERYDPSSSSWVYDSTGATTTGDVADVFTYDKKSIFISCERLGSTNITYRIEGRMVGELDTWSVLDRGDMGTASEDYEKNIVIDVTELVDFIRVGLRRYGTDDTDAISVRGLFRKSN